MLPEQLEKRLLTAWKNAWDWLTAAQSKTTGAWHSETYGGLKSGSGTTTLVLYTWSQASEKQRDQITLNMQTALNFLKAGFAKRKTVAAPDGTMDFPTYGAAYLIIATKQLIALSGNHIKKLDTRALPRSSELLNYLIHSQITEKRGFKLDSPDYGGWDFLGPDDARGITTGSNVSLMAIILEALQQDDLKDIKTARQLAREWLLRNQQLTRDGGFTFTPQADSLNNKAQWHDVERQHPLSYGSATCDGLRALIAAGEPINAAPCQNAIAWLNREAIIEQVPGFLLTAEQAMWAEGLRYYYWQSLARVWHLLAADKRESLQITLAETLLTAQNAAGYWQNRSARMREDDPLLATCFALLAINRLLN
jgi:hypothetical protein